MEGIHAASTPSPLLTYGPARSLPAISELAEEVVQMAFVAMREIDPELRFRLRDTCSRGSRPSPETRRTPCWPRVRYSRKPRRRCPVTLSESLDDAVLPDEILTRRETQMLVHEALMKLPTRNRKALDPEISGELPVAETPAGLDNRKRQSSHC